MTYLLLIGLAVLSLGLAWAATRAVIPWLRRRAILDTPNARSSHDRPTPRGGGIGLLAGLVAGWVGTAALLPGAEPHLVAGLLVGVVALGAVSFVDDLGGLPAALRLAFQLLAVAGVLALLPADALVFQGVLPLPADRIVSALAWLWFINLFNFMDGIDGISGVEAASIGLGLALVAWFVGSFASLGLALCTAAAALGFLAWNWHPARVFLGDVGSVPLGFALGWLLIGAALDGAWAAALILPAYYWADATLTLLKRLARGEAVWRAHRSHFYQRAVQAGMGHAEVARHVLSTNLALLAFGYLSLQAPPWIALVLAVFPVAAVLRRFGRPPPDSASG
jgi:UDP-N-acetylmuramyl pentapeptide phosphotransferase/UDP-N-acetylglucosamine-1-phosphate transferase